MDFKDDDSCDLSQILKKVASESGVSEEEVKKATIDLLNNSKI